VALVHRDLTEALKQAITPTFDLLTIDILPIHAYLLLSTRINPFEKG
jgi:hypothetical protein